VCHHMRHTFITLLILIPGADMPPCNRFTSKLKHTGDPNAASSQGAFRFACVQYRGCRGTSRGGALSVLLIKERRGTVGFGAFVGGGWGLCFYGGVVRVCPVVLA